MQYVLTFHPLQCQNKPRLVQYKPSNIYGPNIIAIEGSDWKRHRAVANSAFNEVSMIVDSAVAFNK
jgi:cytochrome P450